MAFVRFSLRIKRLIAPHIAGETVFDIGAGDFQHSEALATIAQKVIAIEPNDHWGIDRAKLMHANKRLQIVSARIGEIVPPDEPFVLWLSWPVNYRLRGLIDWFEKAKKIVYLGVNDGITACGGPDLWSHLVTREILVESTVGRNRLSDCQCNLVVYGDRLNEGRILRAEEENAILSWIR